MSGSRPSVCLWLIRPFGLILVNIKMTAATNQLSDINLQRAAGQHQQLRTRRFCSGWTESVPCFCHASAKFVVQSSVETRLDRCVGRKSANSALTNINTSPTRSDPPFKRSIKLTLTFDKNPARPLTRSEGPEPGLNDARKHFGLNPEPTWVRVWSFGSFPLNENTETEMVAEKKQLKAFS